MSFDEIKPNFCEKCGVLIGQKDNLCLPCEFPNIDIEKSIQEYDDNVKKKNQDNDNKSD